MANTAREDFERITALARTRLDQVEISQEVDPDRAILTISGYYLAYRIILKETISGRGRRYAYYILSDNRVMAGFDNHPDRQALRLKYGDDFASHLNDLIPHRHGPNKSSLQLTPPWTAEQFLGALDDFIAEIEP